VWTEAAGTPPSVYGEPLSAADGRTIRRWDPTRSKLAAAILNRWEGPIPRPGERWLYLGAASGTTASHVADLVASTGCVFAIEKSPRSFVRLLALARRYPNLAPILADARHPELYLGLVPPVDGLYADIAQSDQVEISIANQELFLRDRGSLLLALKTASMGRERSAADHLARAEGLLEPSVVLESPARLEPFHRQHYLLGGRTKDQAGHGRATTAPSITRRGSGSRAAPRR
jgi:fibrillarin-like pre-rRNA processing protein